MRKSLKSAVDEALDWLAWHRRTSAAIETPSPEGLEPDKLKDKALADCISFYFERNKRHERRRNKLLKMASRKEWDDLTLYLRQSVSTDEIDFDNRFLDMVLLSLFPDLVEKINSALPRQYHITPRQDGRLTTELRIFALMKIGIFGTHQIAQLLSITPATIYNYRSRYKSAFNSESIEAAIKALG